MLHRDKQGDNLYDALKYCHLTKYDVYNTSSLIEDHIGNRVCDSSILGLIQSFF